MKLYKIWQTENETYDTYDGAIVAANSEDEARMMHPSPYLDNWNGCATSDWCDVSSVKVEYIGEAADHIGSGIILGSFNAG